MLVVFLSIGSLDCNCALSELFRKQLSLWNYGIYMELELAFVNINNLSKCSIHSLAIKLAACAGNVDSSTSRAL
jgi:hypothetical protein